MTAQRRRRFVWQPCHIELLIKLYPDCVTSTIADRLGLKLDQVYRKAHLLGIKKTEAFLASEACGRLRCSDGSGARFRFAKGHTPWNKGKKLPGHGCAATQFKKGNRTGKANHLYQPIGSERTSKDGYLQRKINDDLPMHKRWRGVHILIWEAANGPLPQGHTIVFKDGDKTKIELDNLELITRADLMRRNTCHRYPKEIAQLVQLRGVLTRKINNLERISNGQ